MLGNREHLLSDAGGDYVRSGKAQRETLLPAVATTKQRTGLLGVAALLVSGVAALVAAGILFAVFFAAPTLGPRDKAVVQFNGAVGVWNEGGRSAFLGAGADGAEPAPGGGGVRPT